MQINISDRGAVLLGLAILVVAAVTFAPGTVATGLETLANLLPGVVA
jgi:hypothetical protein